MRCVLRDLAEFEVETGEYNDAIVELPNVAWRDFVVSPFES